MSTDDAPLDAATVAGGRRPGHQRPAFTRFRPDLESRMPAGAPPEMVAPPTWQGRGRLLPENTASPADASNLDNRCATRNIGARGPWRRTLHGVPSCYII
jgi:hypothetical protein